MKILHCIAQLPMKTGSGVYFTVTVEGMIKKGYDNAVLYGTQKPFSEQPFSQSLDTLIHADVREFPVEFLTDALPFPIAGMSDEMPYQSTVYSQMSADMLDAWIGAFKKALLKARDVFQPDVIIAHHLFILTSLITEVFPDTRIIAVSHSTDIRQIKRHPHLKERYIHNLDKLHTVFTVTPKDCSAIEALFSISKERIRISGGGFDPRLFNTENRRSFDGTCRLVYAGKISESKGVFELAKTVPLILKRYPHTELTIIGNATDEQKAQLYQNAHGSDRLKICNALTQRDMSALLKTMDIFILPSYYEALGLVAVEALACGLFAVTTEIEGLITLLGATVNTSGIIEYVPLPRIYDVDKAYEEDKPAFVKNLAEKMMVQIKRVISGADIYASVSEEIRKHSWVGIIDTIDAAITGGSL